QWQEEQRRRKYLRVDIAKRHPATIETTSPQHSESTRARQVEGPLDGRAQSSHQHRLAAIDVERAPPKVGHLVAVAEWTGRHIVQHARLGRQRISPAQIEQPTSAEWNLWRPESVDGTAAPSASAAAQSSLG